MNVAEFLSVKSKLQDAVNRFVPFFDTSQLIWCVDNKWLSVLAEAPVNEETTKLLKMLCLSVNPLNNNDTHPLGLRISIDIQSEAAQTILNVKRFTKKVAIEKPLSRGPIIPKIDITCLYEHPALTWVRCELQVGSTADSVSMKDLPFVYYHAYNDTTVEYYFNAKPKSKTPSILKAFETSDSVKTVTFFSGCKNIRPEKYTRGIVLSNLIKFYYCYIAGHQTFAATSTSDYHHLIRLFVACNLYLLRSSLKRYNANSDYNESIFSVMSGTSSKQVMKNMTGDVNMELCSSRDFQTFNLPVNVGGANTSDLVTEIKLT